MFRNEGYLVRAEDTKRRGRLEARISLDLKSQLERAAALKGLTLSFFVVRSMEQVSAKIIAEHAKKADLAYSGPQKLDRVLN